jgi:hypothetical protein
LNQSPLGLACGEPKPTESKYQRDEYCLQFE